MSDSPAPSRPKLPEWTLTVVEAFKVTPKMRRVIVTTDNFETFNYLPGQALVMQIPLADGTTGRRDYTIRSIDSLKKQIALDFVQHGDTPAPNWAKNAKVGDSILARGPRGRTVFNQTADWHLLTGDETCIPAILHILETMPEGTQAFAFIEIANAEEQHPIETKADVKIEWINREGKHAGPSSFVLDRVAAFELPEGSGHAYLIGETSNVRALRHHLIERGLTRNQIASEGYWRPGRIGGHDHVDD